jgi:hypothetical protein
MNFFFFLLLRISKALGVLTIASDVCSHPHTPGNYREESLGSGLKMLVRGFKSRTS